MISMKKMIIIVLSTLVLVVVLRYFIINTKNNSYEIPIDIKKNDYIEEELYLGHLIKDTNTGMIWTTPGYGVLLLSKKEVPWVISHYRY